MATTYLTLSQSEHQLLKARDSVLHHYKQGRLAANHLLIFASHWENVQRKYTSRYNLDKVQKGAAYMAATIVGTWLYRTEEGTVCVNAVKKGECPPIIEKMIQLATDPSVLRLRSTDVVLYASKYKPSDILPYFEDLKAYYTQLT